MIALAKMLFLNKKTLRVALLVSLLLAGWFSRGWYEDSQVKESLDAQVDRIDKQARKDERLIADTESRVREVNNQTTEVIIHATKSTICTDDSGQPDAGDSFISLYSATLQEGPETASSEPDGAP